ncbi:MAG: MFS transporter, partial [Rhodospirillaceae bacterium]
TWAAVLVSALAGASWIAVLSSLHVSVQTALPEWVRARGLSIFLTVFFGAMSLGSLVWGKVADSWSLETALVASAIGAVLLIPVTWRAKLQRAEGLDLTPSMHWPEPVLDPSLSEQQDHGPVMIQIVYQVPMDQETAFLALMETLRHARQRQGAFNWSLMRNAEDPTRFTELWFEASWQQHLRHHARVTGDDRAIQKQLRDHLAPGTDPLITHHMTAEHHPEAPSGQPPDPGAETPVATDQGERP